MTVILYTLPTCEKCKGLKKIMKERKIEFKELDLSNPDNLAILVMKGVNISLAPILEIDGKFYNNHEGILKHLEGKRNE